MSPEPTAEADTQQPVWLVGDVSTGFSAVFPAEGGPSFENEFAASNRASAAYSQQLLQQLIGGFSLPEPGELIECGRSPAPQTMGPSAVERYLLNVPTRLHGAAGSAGRTHRFPSAAELVSQIDAGAVVTADAFGEQHPFARRLREHLGRVTRASCAIELLVLGRGAVAPIDVASAPGGVVLLDGMVDLESSHDLGTKPGSLALGAAVAWNGIGALALRGRERWNSALIVRTDSPDAAAAPSAEASAEAAAICAPIPSGSIISLLAVERFRGAGPQYRADLFVRAMAPGGLVIAGSRARPGADFAIAGKCYGATAVGARAVAMVHAGPARALADLDRLLGSPAAADGFCATAAKGGWLEYCQKGDLLT